MGDSKSAPRPLFTTAQARPAHRAAGRTTARALALGLDPSCSVAEGARELRAAGAGTAAMRTALRRIDPAAPDERSPQGRAAAMLRRALVA